MGVVELVAIDVDPPDLLAHRAIVADGDRVNGARCRPGSVLDW
jgi:hypothetical protein